MVYTMVSTYGFTGTVAVFLIVLCNQGGCNDGVMN